LLRSQFAQATSNGRATGRKPQDQETRAGPTLRERREETPQNRIPS